jgi:hypothetical protein
MKELKNLLVDVNAEQVIFKFHIKYQSPQKRPKNNPILFISILQIKLKNELKRLQQDFFQSLHEMYDDVQIDRELANGIISRVLSNHYDQNYSNLTPKKVKVRPSQRELMDL